MKTEKSKEVSPGRQRVVKQYPYKKVKGTNRQSKQERGSVKA